MPAWAQGGCVQAHSMKQLPVARRSSMKRRQRCSSPASLPARQQLQAVRCSGRAAGVICTRLRWRRRACLRPASSSLSRRMMLHCWPWWRMLSGTAHLPRSSPRRTGYRWLPHGACSWWRQKPACQCCYSAGGVGVTRIRSPSLPPRGRGGRSAQRRPSDWKSRVWEEGGGWWS